MLTFKPHRKAVWGIAFSPDGQLLATGARDEPTRLWSLPNLTEVRQFPEGDFDPSIAFSSDGRFLGRGGDDLSVWAVESGERVVRVKWGQSIAFSPNGKEVATVDLDENLSRCALPKGELLSKRNLGELSKGLKQREVTGPLSYSPDGRNIAVVVAVWRGKRLESHIVIQGRNTGKPRLEIVTDFKHILPTVLSYSPDGAVIAGLYGPVLGVVNAETGERVAAIKPSKNHFTGMAFTPDGERLIAVNTDAAVRVYNTTTWTETTGYEWKIGKLMAVDVAPDGLRAACGSLSGRVVVWDLDN